MQIELNDFFFRFYFSSISAMEKIDLFICFHLCSPMQREKSTLYRTMGTGYVENRIAGKCYGVCTIKLIEFCGFRLACALESWKKGTKLIFGYCFVAFFHFSSVFYFSVT